MKEYYTTLYKLSTQLFLSIGIRNMATGRISNMAGFVVLIAVPMKMPFFRDVTPCSPDNVTLYHRRN
jgi:hypothetical protein